MSLPCECQDVMLLIIQFAEPTAEMRLVNRSFNHVCIQQCPLAWKRILYASKMKFAKLYLPSYEFVYSQPRMDITTMLLQMNNFALENVERLSYLLQHHKWRVDMVQKLTLHAVIHDLAESAMKCAAELATLSFTGVVTESFRYDQVAGAYASQDGKTIGELCHELDKEQHSIHSAHAKCIQKDASYFFEIVRCHTYVPSKECCLYAVREVPQNIYFVPANLLTPNMVALGVPSFCITTLDPKWRNSRTVAMALCCTENQLRFVPEKFLKSTSFVTELVQKHKPTAESYDKIKKYHKIVKQELCHS